MKKYFLYELKKNWIPALIITVFACLIYISSILSSKFIYTLTYEDGLVVDRAANSPLAIPIVILMALCTLVPILMFSFKMSSKQTDCFYSMPLKREKIYLVKAGVGLLETIVPYTICYWLGFIVICIKPNLFDLTAFVSAYFISLPLAVLLFGINAFVFTRANRVADGVIFIGLYAAAVALITAYIFRLINHFGGWYFYNYFSYWFTYSPLTWLSTKYSIISTGGSTHYRQEWLLYLFAAVTGAGAWTGLFLTVKKEKAENTERISDSKFGYIVLIPYYLTFTLALSSSLLSNLYFVSAVIFVISAAVGYIIFRRSVKLKLADLISLAGALVLGIILSLIL